MQKEDMRVEMRVRRTVSFWRDRMKSKNYLFRYKAEPQGTIVHLASVQVKWDGNNRWHSWAEYQEYLEPVLNGL